VRHQAVATSELQSTRRRMIDPTEGGDDSGARQAPGCAAGDDDAESTTGVCWMTAGGGDMESTSDVAISTVGSSVPTPTSST
jgi:hypothetical protein